ncbi:MAG: glucose-6-phosphate isomerase family protein [Methanofollis sp.]|nr:glucose-6-phosphate isomerase family protein [Methanofollis sp.]MDD4255874.1 glucose-6-phosphate isomerase family protein [Methanofollis sp.]
MTDLWPGPLPAPSVRTVDEMRCVLAAPKCAFDAPLYVMYRDCALTPEDRTWLTGQHLRFDLTVIPPATPGGEYVKTKGHDHPENAAGVGHPELYQVLAGEAHFLLQTKDLSDVVVVSARAGDFVRVPPGYGHVTINPGKEVLVMANLVSTRFESEYGFYEEMRGAAYYEREGERWLRNSRYPVVPPIREIPAREIPELGTRHGKGIYDLVSRSADLSFLNEPEKNLGRVATNLETPSA